MTSATDGPAVLPVLDGSDQLALAHPAGSSNAE
jgi:hypothetical protein